MKKLITLILFSKVTLAGILLDPYLGFSIAGGDFELNDNEYKTSYSGMLLGGRAGYKYLGFMGGLDYSILSSEVTSKRNSNEYKADIDKYQFGIFAGYEMPILLRAWMTYYFSAGFKGKKNDSTFFGEDDKLKGGSGFAFGLGYTFLPLFSVNLEYRTIEYDEWRVAGVKRSGVTDNVNFNEIIFSVSMPFDIEVF